MFIGNESQFLFLSFLFPVEMMFFTGLNCLEHRNFLVLDLVLVMIQHLSEDLDWCVEMFSGKRSLCIEVS